MRVFGSICTRGLRVILFLGLRFGPGLISEAEGYRVGVCLGELAKLVRENDGLVRGRTGGGHVVNGWMARVEVMCSLWIVILGRQFKLAIYLAIPSCTHFLTYHVQAML